MFNLCKLLISTVLIVVGIYLLFAIINPEFISNKADSGSIVTISNRKLFNDASKRDNTSPMADVFLTGNIAPATIPPPVSNNNGVLIIAERDPIFLHNKLRNEKRDSQWADENERKLQGFIDNIPYLNSEDSKTICGSTVCEVSGSIIREASIDNVNIAASRIQLFGLNDNDINRDFDTRLTSVTFGSHGIGTDSNNFVRYFFRKGEPSSH